MNGGASWPAITTCFSPSTLFCALNLIIAIIYVTSRFKNENSQEQKQSRVADDSVQLFRVPSLLERVKSINLSRNRVEQPDPSPVDTLYVESTEETRLSSVITDDTPFLHVPHNNDMSSDITDSRQIPREEQLTNQVTNMNDDEEMDDHVTRKQAKMKRAESARIYGMKEVEEEEEVERRRPATVGERKAQWDWDETTSDKEDETVDEKADDFINRFRQHLMLQRIDSLLRNRRVST